MERKLTTQDVVDMAVELYDNKGYSRLRIKKFLMDLLDSGVAEFDLERIFDLIVG